MCFLLDKNEYQNQNTGIYLDRDITITYNKKQVRSKYELICNKLLNKG